MTTQINVKETYLTNISSAPLMRYQIEVGTPTSDLPSNKIKTNKYTLINFLPLNLYEQFRKAANLYFLVIAVLQTLPNVSLTNQIPAILTPLTFVITISAIKDMFEDLRKYFSDKEENEAKTGRVHENQLSAINWGDLQSGMIIRINNHEKIPADVICLYSSNSNKRCCFVETKSLDGETNLKVKKQIPVQILFDENNMSEYLNEVKSYKIRFERENPTLTRFEGELTTPHAGVVNLTNEHLLLRGCVLRNTEFIYAVVIYPGHFSKIMLNTVKGKIKRSKVDRETNGWIKFIFLTQLFFCSFAALYYTLTLYFKRDIFQHFMPFDKVGYVLNFFIKLGNWILIFSNFVPISLIVTVETVKFFQGLLLSRKDYMYTVVKDEHGLPTGDIIKPVAQMSSLNDELGQVNYVLSDKTGTLTQNKMVFHRLLIGDSVYNDVQISSIQDKIYDESLVSALKSGARMNNKEVHALRCLALCHSVIFDEKKQFNSASPEELTFVRFAMNYFFEFHDFEVVDGQSYIIVKEFGAPQRYRLLQTFDFTSDRKKMSVIVEKNGEIYMYTKGADDVVKLNLSAQYQNDMEHMNGKLESLAQEGYRVMLLAMRKISREEWEKLEPELQKARNDPLWMDVIQKRTEVELQLVGSCSIEDQLQDEVRESIEYIREAKIKVWIITGDKGDTAVSVGKNSGLINSTTKIYRFESYTHGEDYTAELVHPCCALVYGSFLGNLLSFKVEEDRTYKSFVKTLIKCDTAIFCRISPRQKQEIVKIIQNYNPDLVTLAIGDGANDASMISAAHIGVGIKGREGDQAARASDYYFGEFRHLVPLIFVFGTESYLKNSNVVLYNFYKNIILVLPQFWFGFFNCFSGISIYEQLLYQLFNVTFAFVPIFIYGVLDKQYSRTELLNNARLYEAGHKRIHFSKKRFVQNFMICIALSVLVTICAYVCFDYNPRQDGNMYGMFNFGNMVFWGVIVLSNLKVLLISSSYSVLQYSILFLSAFSFFPFWYWMNKLNTSLYSSMLLQSFQEVMYQPEFYVFCVMVLMISIGESLSLKMHELAQCRKMGYLELTRRSSLLARERSSNY